MSDLPDSRPNEHTPWPFAIFLMLFGAPFMLVPAFFIGTALQEGDPELLTPVCFFGPPFFAAGIAVSSIGWTALTGKPTKLIGAPKSSGPRPAGKAVSMTFGGKRTPWGPAIIGALLVPFFAAAFIGATEGLAELLSGNLEGVCIAFVAIPFGLIASTLMAGLLTKRYLEIDHKWDTLVYTERLFRWRIGYEKRKVSEASCVREWTVTSTRTDSDGNTHTTETQRIRIMRERLLEDEDWDLDIGMLLHSNGISPEDVAKALGVPYKPRPPLDHVYVLDQDGKTGDPLIDADW